MSNARLPYFDFLLSELEKNNSSVEKSFGRHVHWGFWADPSRATFDDDDYARAAEQLTLELTGLADLKDGQKILDVGCGFGGTVASLNERFQDLDLTGLNIDERQLERARQNVKPIGSNHIDFVQGDACRLPFADASFDRVLAVECIFHFPSRDDFFREVRRVLRPGGTLTLSDFVPSRLFLPICELGALPGFRKVNAIGEWNVRCTLGRYRALAVRTDLQVSVERDISLNTLPTYTYLQRLLAKGGELDRTGRIFSKLLDLNRWLGRTGLLSYYLLSFRKS